MALANRSRIRQLPARALDLPPPFRLVILREVGDALDHACANAAKFEAGALVFVGRFDLAEFAVVLEPEEPLASARRAFYAGMVALGSALAALAPPENPIAIGWPDAVHVDGGLIGGGRLAWPDGADECMVPDWLVFGAMIFTVSMSADEAGLHPLTTALDEEGFGGVGAEHVTEGFARHLMAALDRWQDGDFASIATDYLSRLKPESRVRCDIDKSGDLQIWRAAKHAESRSLREALKVPSWLDPKTGAPRQ